MWNSFTNYEMLLYTQWAPFYSLGKNSVLMFIWDFVVFEIKPVIKRHFLDSNFFFRRNFRWHTCTSRWHFLEPFWIHIKLTPWKVKDELEMGGGGWVKVDKGWVGLIVRANHTVTKLQSALEDGYFIAIPQGHKKCSYTGDITKSSCKGLWSNWFC